MEKGNLLFRWKQERGFGRRLALQRVMEEGSTIKVAAEAFHVSVSTASKCVARYRQAGTEEMIDRDSRPHRLRPSTPPAVAERVKELRLEHRTVRAIAAETGLCLTTVRRILTRAVRHEPLGVLGPNSPGATVRETRAGDAASFRHQEAGSDREGGAPEDE